VRNNPVVNSRSILLGAILVLKSLVGLASEAPHEYRGRQFIGWHAFSDFAQSPGSHPGETLLTSPEFQAGVHFNEAIVSWNAEVPSDCYLVVETRAVYPEKPTKYYTLGVWSTSSSEHPRTSLAGQKDGDADVSTDTLLLRRPAMRIQLRLTLGGTSAKPTLKFLGISLADTTASPPALPACHAAWGKVIAVPERTQMIYPNGKTLCSPTTVSMLLGFWAGALNRPGLDHPVPEIADAIYDQAWKGTGNWPFNMAYAGSFIGMRAYVTRFSDVSEIENWIAQGIPVGLSLDYDRLRAKGPGPNGHLVVCVGFTTNGDPVLNDPGTTEHVRKTFPRANLVDAWACSRNTVYLVYPENRSTPSDTFGHWDSLFARPEALGH
jgi:hypothetical protein